METVKLTPLRIVNASAGSGKTYTLVYTYLTLLFRNEQLDTFSKIVAMTFTNKAALEMKVRIIHSLEALAYPEAFPSEQKKYAEKLLAEFNLKPHELKFKARFILKNILHRFEDFMVLTIDKFNLRLLRSFSRDLDLPPDFEVVINEKEILQKVIETVTSELGTPENEGLSKLALSFSQEKIEDGDKWDFFKDLTDFSKILTQEKNQDLIKILLQNTYDEAKYYQLKKELNGFLETFQNKAEACIESLNAAVTDVEKLNGKTTTYKALTEKILAYDFKETELIKQQRIEDLQKNTKGRLCLPEVAQQYEALIAYHQSIFDRVRFLKLLTKDFHNFALLKIIAKRLLEIRHSEKILLISEFNTLLSNLVQNCEAPFIYDKLGYRYNHFLLDEFQDTSRMQWMNLVPLVHEFISNNQLSFIVGDPKQSIYRFKNGLAEQFVELPRIYNPENDTEIERKSDYFEEMGLRENILQNWRSHQNVVAFNNAYFALVRQDMAPSTQSFYDGLEQECISKKPGLVTLKSMRLEKEDQENDLYDTLLQWIEECTADGYNLADITILGRKNATCNRWANFLTNKGFKVVSAESLMVHSDLQVKYLIAYLNKRLYPSSEFATKGFISYHLQLHKLGLDVYDSYFIPFEYKGRTYKSVDEKAFVQNFFPSVDLFYQNYESIHDLLTKFCGIANIDPLENHYVHHLLDMAFAFDLNHGPDLALFLKNYDREGKKSAVQIPESKDAIRILTVHKSKGLEFPVVIIPEIKPRDEVHKENELVEFEGEVLNLPLSGSQILPALEYKIEDEKEQARTDEINNLYVAFTRPVERLYIRMIMGSRDGSFKRAINEKLCAVMEPYERSEGCYQMGERLTKMDSHNLQVTTNFHPKSLKDFIWFPSISLNERDFDAEENLNEAQNYGTQFHELLSRIDRKEQIGEEIAQMVLAGELEIQFEQKALVEAIAMFDNHLSDLYKGSIQIFSESDILSKEFTKIFRPDKVILHPNKKAVVVDFKTGQPKKKDQQQVLEYMYLVNQMGYETTGRIIYSETGKVVQLP